MAHLKNILASVVIATRNRPLPLTVTLETLVKQTIPPHELIVVDSSDSSATECIVNEFAHRAPFAIIYEHSHIPSAAGQRNTGIDMCSGEIVVFMDDDVELEQTFLKELIQPFVDDLRGEVGGVSGTIVNQVYVPPKGINRVVLGLVMGDMSGKWAGRVVGPVVNFLPEDVPDTVQRVEWLNTGGTGYRRCVLSKYRFGQQFSGYSFAEDLHLSSRVGNDYVLLNTTRARYLHHDMGQATHKDWVALGESSVVNRYSIMTDVLKRNHIVDLIRFAVYEIVYGVASAIVSSRLRPKRLRQLCQLFLGKVRGFWIIWTLSKGKAHA